MTELPIVDSHVHLWDPAKFRYAWLDGLATLNRAFLPSDLLAASKGTNLRKIIFVESGLESSQALAEVDWVGELAKGEPRLKGMVAHAPLERGEAARAELELLASRPLVKGVRRLLQGEPGVEFCRGKDFVAGVKLLAEFGFTFDLCIRRDQLSGVVQLAQGIPEVTFVLDHLAKPDVRGGQVEPWASELKKLGALPNVVCKISGLATEADWGKWQATELKPYFERAVECFGFDRLMFGGDWPVATLATSYQRWIETVREAFAFAKEAEQLKLFKANAERVYRV